jgi:hypothetical protein
MFDHKESFGSEGEYIGKKSRRATDKMSNGDNKQVWDIVFKVSQLVAPLILLAMVYLLIQQSGMDKRIAVIEVTIRNQPVDVAMVRQFAVFEERQNLNTMKINSFEEELRRHREQSTYDPAGVTRRIPRER